MGDGGLLTVKETAAKLKVTTRYVYKLIQKGELEVIKLGTNNRIEEGELRRYIDNNRLRKGADHE